MAAIPVIKRKGGSPHFKKKRDIRVIVTSGVPEGPRSGERWEKGHKAYEYGEVVLILSRGGQAKMLGLAARQRKKGGLETGYSFAKRSY